MTKERTELIKNYREKVKSRTNKFYLFLTREVTKSKTVHFHRNTLFTFTGISTIYAIYGFVRLADEIVDSFHGYDKALLLNELNEDLDYALKNSISTNTILTAFTDTVKKYSINTEHIQAFMKSRKTTYQRLNIKVLKN